jgi:uncharacterized membrane protein YeiH
MLGLATAIGGGVTRDLILGNTPPAMFREPIYALLALACALVAFIPAVRRFMTDRRVLCGRILLILDSVGLGAFTAVGVQAAFDAGFEDNLFLQIFVGVMTGIGGGILRDVLSGSTPYVFSKHFYACASLIGAAVCAVCWKSLGEAPAMILGAASAFILRLCTAHFRWNLPRA